MEAAERHLPQARRNAVLRQYRQSGVQLARRGRRNGPADEAGDDDEEAPPASFAALPPDVIGLVFRRLDPLTLARAACVSREWRAAASEGALWEAHCAALLARPGGSGARKGGGSGGKVSSGLAGGAAAGGEQPRDGSAGGACSSSNSWQRRFASLAAQHPQRLRRWKTTRVLVGGRLAWLPPGQLLPPRARHLSTAAVGAYCRSGGRHAGSAGGSSGGSGSSGSSSESDGGGERLTSRLRFWQL